MKSAFGEGIRFGIILQLAIGPLCLLTFHTGATQGFIQAMLVVSGICLIDMFYMFLAGCGVAKLMQSDRMRRRMRLFATIVLAAFGLNMIANSLNISVLPNLALSNDILPDSMFVRSIILTASDPLTILFFSGMFSERVAEKNYGVQDLTIYAAGVMVVTVLFLSGVAAMSSVLSTFLAEPAIRVLNAIVGCFLIYFGLKWYVDYHVTQKRCAK